MDRHVSPAHRSVSPSGAAYAFERPSDTDLNHKDNADGFGLQPGGCANMVLRLLGDRHPGRSAWESESESGIDLDALGADLHRLWQSFGTSGRRAARIEVSCVESCAESRAERERDARRLIELEGEAHRGGGLANALRATLVRLDPGEYLLLLAAPAAASAASLSQLVRELARHYPLAPA